MGSVSVEVAILAIRAHFDGSLGNPFKRRVRNERIRSVIVNDDPTGSGPLDNIFPEQVQESLDRLDAVPQWIVIQHIKLRRNLGTIAKALDVEYGYVLENYGQAVKAVADHLSKVI